MKNAIVNLRGFYMSEPKVSTDGSRVDFSLISSQKAYNGQYLKLFCTAFREEAAKIIRLKASKGSLVDVIAEMVPYVRDGKAGMSYTVMSFDFSDYAKAEPKETSPQEEKEDKLREAARLLATNPFI